MKTDEVFIATTSGPVSARINRECGIFIWNDTLKKGAAILLSDLTQATALFAQALAHCESKLGAAQSLTIKGIGPQMALDDVALVLARKNLGWTKTLDTHGKSFELVWDGLMGKVQFRECQEMTRARVLIVDDSSTIRQLLKKILSKDPGLEVVGEADHPHQVDGLIAKLRPDVITLDIHMPDQDGVELLKQIFPRYRIPAVMISSLSMEESDHVFRALELGAVDYIQKPSMSELGTVAPLIIEKVRAAAYANLQKSIVPLSARAMSRKFTSHLDTSALIAIGSSTGGTEALRALLVELPDKIPPILIVQHIPPVFSNAFAQRLNSLCKFEVKEAADGDEVKPNRVLIAPGGKQMRIVVSGGKSSVRITDDAPVNRHKPSVDVLFESVAAQVGARAIGVILTGMGSDGAKGLLTMKNAGSLTLAQDESTCVVFGMPKEAIRLGAAKVIKPLPEIAPYLCERLSVSAKTA